MIYTLENTAAEGKPMRVYDATGKEWLDVVACDTETGCIKKHLVIWGFTQVDPFENETIKQILYVPAPLTVVPWKEHGIPCEERKLRTFGCICVQDKEDSCLACTTEKNVVYANLSNPKEES